MSAARPSATPRASLWALGLATLAFAVVCVLVWRIGDDNVRWWALALPLVITGAPLIVRHQRVRLASAAVLTLFCVITGASIGIYFVPALLAAFAAATTIGRGQESAA